MNSDFVILITELSADIAKLIKIIEKYYDIIHVGSIKSQGYINFKKAIMDVKAAINSAEAHRLS